MSQGVECYSCLPKTAWPPTSYIGVIIHRLFNHEVTGLLDVIWDRDILAFFLIGLVLFGQGILGEYVGRIHMQVRYRPRYRIGAILESPLVRGTSEDDSTLPDSRPALQP